MAGPQLKDSDESIYDLLGSIRRRPGLYIADSELTRLHSFIIGYECGLGRGGLTLRREDPAFHGFHDWIAHRLSYAESTSGWYKMIRGRCSSEREAFDKFYELLDEFRGVRAGAAA